MVRMHRTVGAVVFNGSTNRVSKRCLAVSVVSDLAALSQNNYRNRLGQDLRVKQQRPIVHIVKIETNTVLEVRIRASADLPEPRQSRLHAQPRVVLPVSRRQV